MTCKKIQPNLSAFIDGELDRSRSQAVVEHLAVCVVCEAELRQLRQVIHWTREVPEQEPPAALPTRILHAVAVVRIRRPQPVWSLLTSLHLPRTFAWAACTGAAAAVAVALASHRTPGQSLSPRVTIREASIAPVTVRPVAPSLDPRSPTTSAPTARVAPAGTPPLTASAASVAQRAATGVLPASAPRPTPRASGTAGLSPGRTAPAVDAAIQAPPVVTEAAPAPVGDLKQAEPPAPMEMEPGPGMMTLGAMTPGPDAAPAGVMGITTDTPKMMKTGTGTNPIPGDYGVDELRQFLQEQKNSPGTPRDPQRERNPG